MPRRSPRLRRAPATAPSAPPFGKVPTLSPGGALQAETTEAGEREQGFEGGGARCRAGQSRRRCRKRRLHDQLDRSLDGLGGDAVAPRGPQDAKGLPCKEAHPPPSLATAMASEDFNPDYLVPGTRIGAYVVQGLLGQGG